MAYFPAYEWGREEFFLSNHSGSEVLSEASTQLKAAEDAASLADLINVLSNTWAEEDTRNAGLPSSPRLIYEYSSARIKTLTHSDHTHKQSTGQDTCSPKDPVPVARRVKKSQV